MTRIVALTGIRGAGKTTVAMALMSALPDLFAYAPFKSPVLEDFYEANMRHAQKPQDTEVLNKITYKGRKRAKDYWVRRYKEYITRPELRDKILIADDLRFPEHYRFLRNISSPVIEIRRGEPESDLEEDSFITLFKADFISTDGCPDERAAAILKYLNIEPPVIPTRGYSCTSCYDSICEGRCNHV